MKILFEDTGIEELIKNGSSKKYKKIAKNKAFVEDLRVVYSILLSANKTADLAKYKSLHYEKLKYNMSGFSSVRNHSQKSSGLFSANCRTEWK